jgi:septal ring factor EnvC (AmiA/AmiB activator)
MCQTKIRKFMLSLPLLVLLCSLPAFGFSAQAEKMYQISESELNQLEQNSTKQEENSRNNQKTLQEQETQLKKAGEKIQKSEAENKAMKNSLEKTQKFLDAYEKEAEHKIQIKERQRDLWEVISAGLFAAVVTK